MSLEEFLALGEDVHAEYSDGMAIFVPPALMSHNELQVRLLMLLRAALPSLYVGLEMGVVLGPRRRRQPDVAVIDHLERTQYTEQTPHLVVEVLSPSTRNEDLVRKSHEYAQAGVGQYWIVDDDARTLTVYTRDGDGWETLLELDDTRPRGEVSVGEHGAVALDLEDLLDL